MVCCITLGFVSETYLTYSIFIPPRACICLLLRVFTCVLMCCSGAVTRLAQLSHNMTMIDRKRQAAKIHRGRPERLENERVEHKKKEIRVRRGEQREVEIYRNILWGKVPLITHKLQLTLTCSRGSRAQPWGRPRAGPGASLCRLFWMLPSRHAPSHLQDEATLQHNTQIHV